MKKIKLLAVTIIACMSLAACSGDSDKPTEGTQATKQSVVESDPVVTTESAETIPESVAESKTNNLSGDADQLLDDALQKMDELDSYEMNATIRFKMSFMGESMQSESRIEAVVFANPIKMKLYSEEYEIEDGEESGDVEQVYIAEVDGSFLLYEKNANGVWESQNFEGRMLDSLFEDFGSDGLEFIPLMKETQIKSEDAVTLNGYTATQVDGIVLIDEAGEIFPGLLDAADMLELLETAAFIDNFKGLPMSVWIDNETGCVVQIHIDMIEMMDSLVKLSMELGMEEDERDMIMAMLDLIKIEDTGLKVNFSALNSAADFALPEVVAQ